MCNHLFLLTLGGSHPRRYSLPFRDTSLYLFHALHGKLLPGKLSPPSSLEEIWPLGDRVPEEAWSSLTSWMRFPGFSRAHLWTNPLSGPCVYLSSSPESILAACVDAGSVCVQVWVYGLCDLMGPAEELLDDPSLSTVSVGVAPWG